VRHELSIFFIDSILDSTTLAPWERPPRPRTTNDDDDDDGDDGDDWRRE
jgi:hypothetical protein